MLLVSTKLRAPLDSAHRYSAQVSPAQPRKNTHIRPHYVTSLFTPRAPHPPATAADLWVIFGQCGITLPSILAQLQHEEGLLGGRSAVCVANGLFEEAEMSAEGG